MSVSTHKPASPAALAGRVCQLGVSTKLGRFQLLASENGLRALYWPGCAPPSTANFSPISAAPASVARLLEATAGQLRAYFSGQRVSFTARLDLSPCTAFAGRVLEALARVPYGRTITYGQLARLSGSPSAARAVGSVLARNPLPIIVPCHRVLAGRGTLGGFSAPGGLELKRRLLEMENIPLPPR